MVFRKVILFGTPVVAVIAMMAWSPRATATPAFARKQQLGCPVCHTTFPELNATGRAFKENGYRFPAKDNAKKVDTTGTDVGSGIILDPFPGIAVRVESVPVSVEDGEIGSTPLDSAELIMGGSNGHHWSYWAEVASEVDNGYVPSGNGLIQYRASREITAYAGWTPVFSRDGYNAISESRRIDHVDHAAQDYAGSVDANLSEEAGIVGAFGRFGPVYYNVGVTPGPGVIGADPIDGFGRVEVDLSKKVGVGGYVYEVDEAPSKPAGNDVRTTRAALDFNALTDFGTFKVLGQYDTKDGATCVEAGWDVAAQQKGFWIVPQARVDVTSTSDGTVFQPMAGVGLQQSSGRVQIEVSDPIGEAGASPTANLIVDGVF